VSFGTGQGRVAGMLDARRVMNFKVARVTPVEIGETKK